LNLDSAKARLTSRRHPFPDGKARRLTLRVNGLARTAEYMSTVSRVARFGDPWLQGSGLVFDENELVPSERLSPELQRNLSEEKDVILPATIRPAMVEAKAPVPVFEHFGDMISTASKATELTYTRHACVRLRMRRGWFSSGVDEKLGIVLWPPNQGVEDAADLALNRVKLRASDPCGNAKAAAKKAEDRMVALTQFADEDLGPGGRFVTRRGSDPVRMPEFTTELNETQVFLSQTAFPDLWRHPDDPARASFVPDVLMPLSDTGTRPDADDKAGEQIDVTPPMTVGLVTYEPRFDIEKEEWFVNVLMTPGRSADAFVRFGLVRYQPHTRPDLRCSRPTVQWAQPLPERRLTVTLSEDRKSLTVDMAGPTSKGRADEPGAKDPTTRTPTPFEKEVAERDAPRMRLRAFVDGETPSGTAAREDVVLNATSVTPETGAAIPYMVKDDRGNDTGVEVNLDLENAEGHWRAKIDLEKLAGIQLSHLKIRIEEVEYFLPADLGENEPIGPEAFNVRDAVPWRESGVRFSKVISLSELMIPDLVDN
ncbi:MAG: hypothetical protein AAFZ06_11315, partial [Pseudomonadota bacterium]